MPIDVVMHVLNMLEADAGLHNNTNLVHCAPSLQTAAASLAAYCKSTDEMFRDLASGEQHMCTWGLTSYQHRGHEYNYHLDAFLERKDRRDSITH